MRKGLQHSIDKIDAYLTHLFSLSPHTGPDWEEQVNKRHGQAQAAIALRRALQSDLDGLREQEAIAERIRAASVSTFEQMFLRGSKRPLGTAEDPYWAKKDKERESPWWHPEND